MLSTLSRLSFTKVYFSGVQQLNIRIRPSTAKDVRAVSELFDHYIQGAGKPSNLAAVKAYIADRLTKKDSTIFLALKNAVPIGFIQLFRQFGATSMQPITYIQDLFVKPQARGHGAATALIEQAKAFAQQAGAKLTLKTRLENTTAQRLYQFSGFQETERSNKYVYYEWVKG
jgi:ribosomal protein S18 acetylase RimI-like enzyme